MMVKYNEKGMNLKCTDNFAPHRVMGFCLLVDHRRGYLRQVSYISRFVI